MILFYSGVLLGDARRGPDDKISTPPNIFGREAQAKNFIKNLLDGLGWDGGEGICEPGGGIWRLCGASVPRVTHQQRE